MDFRKLKKNLKKDVAQFPSYRAALLGDSATQMLNQAIRGYAIGEGLHLDVFEADYDQIERQVYDSESELYQSAPQFVIIFQSAQKLMAKFHKLPKEKQAAFADDHLANLRQLWDVMNRRISCTIINFNFVEVDDGVFGNFATKTSYSFLYQLRKINFELMNLAGEYRNVFINDVSAMHNRIGSNTAFDTRMYVSAKMVFGIDFLPHVAKGCVDIIKAATGKIKKCLILDLDNTTWGGVIGDDGMEKIQIGDLGVGRAFTELQSWAKQLKDRGIVLAICSKNTEHIAKEPFEKHPDMVLRLDDIGVFVANWENKADNIKHIQSILNIGFDSMVFIDDNPFERNLVRQMLPDVTVPELPEDPAEYMPFLRSLNLFETTAFSQEDGKRTSQYQAEAKRRAHQQAFSSLDEYLKKLEMLSLVKHFDEFHLPRIAQLIQRSNQFNLRTIRHSEQDIQQIMAGNDFLDLYFTLEDRFGEHGLISVVILKKGESPENAFIDTWIMSCRVLKRGMEDFALNKIVERAAKAGYKKLIGEYLQTPKNGIVKDHYQELGFKAVNGHWELDIDAYQTRPTFIEEKSE